MVLREVMKDSLLGNCEIRSAWFYGSVLFRHMVVSLDFDRQVIVSLFSRCLPSSELAHWHSDIVLDS